MTYAIFYGGLCFLHSFTPQMRVQSTRTSHFSDRGYDKKKYRPPYISKVYGDAFLLYLVCVVKHIARVQRNFSIDSFTQHSYRFSEVDSVWCKK